MEPYMLFKWEMSYLNGCYIFFGNVIGNPEFKNGKHIHTSAVEFVDIKDDALYVTTKHSIYKCPYEWCAHIPEENPLFDYEKVVDIIAERYPELKL